MNKRTVILMRHAKSSWADLSLGDKGRPLNDRGKRDAPLMAMEFSKRYSVPDVLLVSSAKRTKMTAAYFKDQLNLNKDNIRFFDQLYGAHPHDVIDLIQEQDASFNSLMIFGHNPTMSDLASTFSKEKVEDVPTAGMMVLSYLGEDWLGFNEQTAQFEAFYYPKQFLKR